MAYIQDGEYYVWSDGEDVIFNAPRGEGLVLPMAHADAFAAMHFAKMLERGDAREAFQKAADYGTLSADSVKRVLGLPTTMDELRSELGI